MPSLKILNFRHLPARRYPVPPAVNLTGRAQTPGFQEALTVFSNRATASMWWVWGNMSTGWTSLTR